jgi:hypothetical protein
LHNKPWDCGVSLASAAGPFSTKKQCSLFNEYYQCNQHNISTLLYKGITLKHESWITEGLNLLCKTEGTVGSTHCAQNIYFPWFCNSLTTGVAIKVIASET